MRRMWTPEGRAATSGARPPVPGARRGQIMVLFALMLPVLIAMAGLIVDGGRFLAERQQVQAAVDAAAWAAANEVLYGTPANAEDVARWYLTQQGFGADSGATVRVNRPPVSGAYLGQVDYIQVRVERPLTLTLAQIMHPDPLPVTASATGGPSPGPAPYGLLALNPASGGIDLSGTVSVAVQNSSAASNYQITANGGAALHADQLVLAHRGISGDATGVRGTQRNAPLVPDPLGRLPAPPPPGTTWGGLNLTSSGQVVSVQPGRWTGDLRVRGVNNTVTLAPGLYYFDQGANLDVFGVGNRVVGSGVLIYLAAGSTISVAGGADLALSAPAAAPYASGAGGLVVFAARDNSGLIDVNGGAGTSLTGTVYAPAAGVRLTGGTMASIGRGQLLADHIQFVGTSTLSVRYDPTLVVAQPRPALLE